MTRLTNLCLMVLLSVFTSSMAKTITKIDNSNSSYVSSNIQRVRIDFKMPDGFTRHLLLAFTKDNSARDGYDYGYDALNKDAFPYDLNWLVDNQRCTIQGVGAFDDSKKYPFWMFMSESGAIEIALDTLENFDTPIDVFIYDALHNTYTQINDSNYATSMASGEYSDRFFIAFKDENISNTSNDIANTSESGSDAIINGERTSVANNRLDFDEKNIQNTRINYLSNTKELYVNTNVSAIIKTINIYNILGQNIMSLSQVNSKLTKIPMDRIKEAYAIVSIETDKGIINKKLLMH